MVCSKNPANAMRKNYCSRFKSVKSYSRLNWWHFWDTLYICLSQCEQ